MNDSRLAKLKKFLCFINSCVILGASKTDAPVLAYGWTVQDQKKDISISNEQGVIIHASKRKGYDAPTYILDFQQEGDELVSLMLMLILISREFEI